MSVNEPRRIVRRREPMFNAPVVVLGLIAVLIGVYAAYNWAPEAIQNRIVLPSSSNIGVQTVMSGRCVPPL